MNKYDILSSIILLKGFTIKNRNINNYLIRLFFILSSFVAVTCATANERISQQESEELIMVPLKAAIGEKLYDDAMKSGDYRYVGNSKCRLCHRKFFVGRKNDPHDFAMKSLVEGGHEKDEKCLICHSTGFGVPTGFVSLETTPRLANVQCEGCHGPGNVHIANAKKKIKAGFLAGQDNPERIRNMCKSCHTERWNRAYHDLNTSYDTYKSADPRYRKK